MKIIIYIFTIIIIFSSCKTDKITVRLQNVSDYDFKQITARLGDTLILFKDLKKGAKTISFKTNSTYGYCYSQIIFVNNDTVTLRPIDYVGEKLYKRGKIKMKFDIYKNHVSNNKYIVIKTRRQL